jgi:hypothetical protein
MVLRKKNAFLALFGAGARKAQGFAGMPGFTGLQHGYPTVRIFDVTVLDSGEGLIQLQGEGPCFTPADGYGFILVR